jgi:hypothetical protein
MIPLFKVEGGIIQPHLIACCDINFVFRIDKNGKHRLIKLFANVVPLLFTIDASNFSGVAAKNHRLFMDGSGVYFLRFRKWQYRDGLGTWYTPFSSVANQRPPSLSCLTEVTDLSFTISLTSALPKSGFVKRVTPPLR